MSFGSRGHSGVAKMSQLLLKTMLTVSFAKYEVKREQERLN